MRRLLQFLYQYRSFLLFILLEILSFWLIVQNNNYQGAKYFNSANGLSASISEASSATFGFFDLPEQNRLLAEENARLKKMLSAIPDSIPHKPDTLISEDSTIWKFIASKVINNSVFLHNNHLTVNKGSKDGVYKGMGVIGSAGAVGQVVAVSDHFSSVASILNGSILVSSLHKSSGSLCTTSWGGKDPLHVNIEYLPRHLSLYEGDTIVTSGYNTLFPPNTLVGVLDQISIADDATFYEAKAKLATDFYRLSYVYLVDFKLKEQKDSLENSQVLRYE